MTKAADIQALLEKLPEADREAASLLLEKVYADVPDNESIYPAQKKAPKNTLPEYYLIIESLCRLCGGLTTSFFLMKENERGGLSSTSLKELPDDTENRDVKMDKRQTLTCSKCSLRLFDGWSKIDLVHALIKARGMK